MTENNELIMKFGGDDTALQAAIRSSVEMSTRAASALQAIAENIAAGQARAANASAEAQVRAASKAAAAVAASEAKKVAAAQAAAAEVKAAADMKFRAVAEAELALDAVQSELVQKRLRMSGEHLRADLIQHQEIYDKRVLAAKSAEERETLVVMEEMERRAMIRKADLDSHMADPAKRKALQGSFGTYSGKSPASGGGAGGNGLSGGFGGILDTAIKLELVMHAIKGVIAAAEGATKLWAARTADLKGNAREAAQGYIAATEAIKKIPVVGEVAYGAASFLSKKNKDGRSPQEELAAADEQDRKTADMKQKLKDQKEASAEAQRQAAKARRMANLENDPSLQAMDRQHEQTKIAISVGVQNGQLTSEQSAQLKAEEDARYKQRRELRLASVRALASAEGEFEDQVAQVNKQVKDKTITRDAGESLKAAAREQLGRARADAMKAEHEGTTSADKQDKLRNFEKETAALVSASEERERKLREGKKFADADIEAANRDAMTTKRGIQGRRITGDVSADDVQKEVDAERQRQARIKEIKKSERERMAAFLNEVETNIAVDRLRSLKRFDEAELLQLRASYGERIAAAKTAAEKEALIREGAAAESTMKATQAEAKANFLADRATSLQSKKLRAAGREGEADILELKAKYKRELENESDPEKRAAILAEAEQDLKDSKRRNAGSMSYMGIAEASKSIQSRLLDLSPDKMNVAGDMKDLEGAKPKSEGAAASQTAQNTKEAADALKKIADKMESGQVAIVATAGGGES